MLKNKIKIDNKFKETYVTVFFAGNKEEVIWQEKKVFLWCQEYDDYEEWLELAVRSNFYLNKYLSNKETLLSLIKESDLKLFKRYYSNYNEFVFQSVISFKNAEENNLVLPNEKATLGYNFMDKYNKICYFNDISAYVGNLERVDGTFMPVQNYAVKSYSQYSKVDIYENTSLKRVS